MTPVSDTNEVYFVYTQNNIPMIGGTTPQGVEIGIGKYKNICAGKANDALLLLNISEFNPITVTKDAALGLSLIGVTSITDMRTSKTRNLTNIEKLQQTAAVAVIHKLRVRFEIRSAIGDTDDLIADLSKRIALLERMVMYYMDSVLNSSPIPAGLLAEYKLSVSKYISDIAAGTIKDSIDLETSTSLISKLSNRYTQIADIVATTK